jgi:putative transposase
MGRSVRVLVFTIPTAGLRVLFVLVVLAHHRRRVVHFSVTEHPTAAWTAQQLVDAFPDDAPPSYLLRDRDGVYGESFRQRVQGMRIDEVLTAPQSPWQNPFAERLIGSLRRECLDHVVVLGERHLRRLLTTYLEYHHRTRTHLSRRLAGVKEPRACVERDSGSREFGWNSVARVSSRLIETSFRPASRCLRETPPMTLPSDTSPSHGDIHRLG